MRSTIAARFPTTRSFSLEDTDEIGAALSRHLFSGLLILLKGDLGTGKTALTQSIGRALGVKRIKSPTFAIESMYELPDRDFSMVHVDLYRLDDCAGMAGQMEEHLDDGSLLLVEWGERWETPPFEDRWDIELSQTGETVRSVDLSAFGERALSALSDAYRDILCAQRRTEGETQCC